MFVLGALEPLSKAAPPPTGKSRCKTITSKTVIGFCFLSEVGVGLLMARISNTEASREPMGWILYQSVCHMGGKVRLRDLQSVP